MQSKINNRNSKMSRPTHYREVVLTSITDPSLKSRAGQQVIIGPLSLSPTRFSSACRKLGNIDPRPTSRTSPDNVDRLRRLTDRGYLVPAHCPNLPYQ